MLPLRQKSKIMECCNQVSLRHVVLEKWNIRKNNMHDGITVLFYGCRQEQAKPWLHR